MNGEGRDGIISEEVRLGVSSGSMMTGSVEWLRFMPVSARRARSTALPIPELLRLPLSDRFGESASPMIDDRSVSIRMVLDASEAEVDLFPAAEVPLDVRDPEDSGESGRH